MDYQSWMGRSFPNVLAYNMMAIELTEDAAIQLGAKGNRIHRAIQQNYIWGLIATSADGKQFAQIETVDLRDGDGWFDNVKVTPLNYDRTPAGEAVIVKWPEIGEAVAKFFE